MKIINGKIALMRLIFEYLVIILRKERYENGHYEIINM